MAVNNAHNTERKNRILAVSCVVLVAGMIGMAYAAVPLYALFCQVTGYGGTTQRAEAPSGEISSRVIGVRFDANVNNDLNWDFKPVQRKLSLKVGEHRLAFYRATNRSDEKVIGSAVFNVTPVSAGAYFNKIECFCFTEQTLNPGESVEMPVSFYIDPDIENDEDLETLKTITLSYTFFPAKKENKAKSARVDMKDEAIN
ncbi:MAG: cytochrome c oxidase assembly protein [Hyphomicrobiales bacterium]